MNLIKAKLLADLKRHYHMENYGPPSILMNEYHKNNVRPLMADNQPLWRCLFWACLNPSSYYRTNPCYRPTFYRPTLARLIWICTTLRKQTPILALKLLEIYLKFLIWFGFSIFFFDIKWNIFLWCGRQRFPLRKEKCLLVEEVIEYSLSIKEYNRNLINMYCYKWFGGFWKVV